MDRILCLNAGSSSLKFALFDCGDPERVRLAAGKIENIGLAPHLIVRDAAGATLVERRWSVDDRLTHEDLLEELLLQMDASVGEGLVGVGHRIVHGGPRRAAPARLDPALIEELEALTPLAPLHQPHNLAAVRTLARLRPTLPQVACFDTAFHQGQAAVATRFALPRALAQEGVRRYGFHGLSYDYIARQLRRLDPQGAGGRVIAAHLGNGASLCAMRHGRSVDTTMGFTALDGLVMGTRCGALDPGVVLYLLQAKGLSSAQVEHLLYNQSGLLGVSGLSSDMRTLLASAEATATEAIELFTWQIARQAGALASSLEGLDSLVFTAGIGENAPRIRAEVSARLAWLGVDLDGDANRRGASIISTPASRVIVRVIPTDEEQMIGRHTLDVLRGDLDP